MAATKKTFEGSMARVEEIVQLLERGEAPLEESITLYEEAMKLIHGCSDLLEKAEQKVARLIAPEEKEPEEN